MAKDVITYKQFKKSYSDDEEKRSSGNGGNVISYGDFKKNYQSNKPVIQTTDLDVPSYSQKKAQEQEKNDELSKLLFKNRIESGNISNPIYSRKSFVSDYNKARETGLLSIKNPKQMSREQLIDNLLNNRTKYEEATAKEEEFRNKTEEEKKEARADLWDTHGKKGRWDYVFNTGIPYVQNRYGDYLLADENGWADSSDRWDRRPDDYEDGNNRWNYDRILYDALHGNGAYDAWTDSIETDEESDEQDAYMDALWDSVEKKELPEEYYKIQDELREKEGNLSGNFGSEGYRKKIEEAEKELEARETIDEYMENAPEDVSGAFDPSLVQTQKIHIGHGRGAARVRRSKTVAEGDEIDNIYLKANTPQDMTQREGRQYTELHPAQFMDPDQLEQFNKYYNSGDKQSALAFYKELESTYLQEMKMQAKDMYEQDMSQNEYAPLMVGQRLATQPVAGVTGTVGAGLALAGVDWAKDYNNEILYGLSRTNQNIQNTRAYVWGKQFKDWFGGSETAEQIGQFLNGVVYSMADNMVALAIGKGASIVGNQAMSGNIAEKVIQFVMSSEATASEMYQALKENKDPTEAALSAFGNGIIEAITEKYSIEALLKPDVKDLLGDWKQIAKYIGKNAFAEGSEEVASDMLGTVLDEFMSRAYGHKSELQARYDELKGEYGDKEASRMVLKEYLGQLGTDFLAGSLSGLLMSGGNVAQTEAAMAVTGEKALNSRNGYQGSVDEADTRTVADVQADNALKLVEGGKKMKPDTQSHRIALDIEHDMRDGKKISKFKSGKLVQAIMGESSDQIGAIAKDALKTDIKNTLAESGVQNADEMAEIVEKKYFGEELTEEESAAFNDSSAAQQTLMDYKFDLGTIVKAKEGIQKATEGIKSIQENVTNLFKEGGRELKSGVEKMFEGATTAAKADVLMAGGSKGTGTEVLADGKILDIDHVEMQTNEDGEQQLMLFPKDGGEAVAAADVKAVDGNMAKALQFFTSDGMKTISNRFANVMMKHVKDIRDIGTAMSDALNVRLDTMFGKTNTKTQLSDATVQEIREATLQDFEEAEEQRVSSQKQINPGEGKTSFNGAEFGTKAFGDAIKGLSKNIRQEAYAIGEIAKAAGFNVQLIYDETNTKMQGWFSATGDGVTINLAGENAGGEHHSALATLSHEITHWLEANSKEAYARLRQFVFGSLENQGVNLRQRLEGIIDNYAHNDVDIDLNGAMAEMVAQGCDQILSNEDVIAHMKESEPGLFGDIRKAVANLINRVRSAISRMKGSMSYESRNLQGYMDQLGKLWNLAYDEARGQVVNAEDVSRAAASLQASVQDYAQHRKQTIDIKDALKNPKKYKSYFTYDNLIKKDPIQAVQLNQIDINKTRADIMNEEMASAIKNGRKEGDFAYIKVYDIGTEIRVGKRGLRHSLDHLRLSQPIAEKLGEVLKESVLINTADGRVNGQVGNYYLLGAGRNSNGKGITYALFTINKYTTELEDVDFMYAMRTTGADVENNKKPDANMAKVPANNSIPLSDFNVNIAKALNDVKDSFANVLPENVLERFGIKRENIQDDNKKYLQHSIQDNIYDEAGKDAELQRLKAEAEKYRETRDSARNKYNSLIKSDDMKAFNERIAKTNTDEENNKLIEEMLAWQEENGLDRLKNEADEAERKLKEAQKAYDNYQDQVLEKTEQRMIEDSGMNEADWRRKQAINQYGYTGDYREAGYLLPNGRMLNFTGSKGQHYGMRGNDHRDIGIVYATKQGSEAMNAFMNDGNIRVMAETPGVDIVKEPTTAQYTAIRNMAYRFAGEEYFSVDFSDERGNNIGSLEYDGHVNPSKVVNDIRTFFRTGQVPQQSLASQFHYSVQDDAAYMDAVNSGDTQTAQDYVNAAAKANGYTITAFHGTGRADRVGTVFLPERATSGPMAFFTDSREIAGNYARDKQDTSIAYDEDYGDYYNQFRVTLKDGKNVPVGKLWNTLSFAERQKITENARHITLDDDAENIIYDKNAQNGVGNFTDYERKLHGWNSIDTLIDGWLESGTLWDREGDFLKVLELAGIKNVTWNDPNARHEKVYDVYLNIQNPFDTGTMYTNKFLDDMAKWWKKQDHAKYESESMGADFWDKRSITVDEWIEDARREVEEGTSHNWTRIPDGVTAYLQAKGYDGIKDQGGKGGGAGHTVWIPFSSEQIKSADPYTYDDQGNIIPPSERFNSKNRDIRYAIQDIADQEAASWMDSVNPTSLQTEAERMLLDNYKGLQIRIGLKRDQIEKTRKQIREIERTPEGERTPEQQRMLKNLNIKLQNYTTVKDQAMDELAKITGTKGYAKLMHEQNRIFNNFIYGKTQSEVLDAVKQMDQNVENISRRIDENRAEVERIEQEGAIGKLKQALGTTTADRAAGELKKQYHSSWTKGEIRNFLDPILIKMANGEDFSSDVEELAGILIRSNEELAGMDQDLSELRGETIVLNDSQLRELKGQNSSLKEVRSRLAGTGIKVISGKNGANGTLVEDLESFTTEYPFLAGEIDTNEKNALESFLTWVEGRKDKGLETIDYAGQLADTMAVVMQKAAGVAHGIYIPTEAKAQKQVLALIEYVRGLNAKTEAAEKALQDIAAEMAEMKRANAQAIGMANVLTQNVGEALKYYDATAKLAMDTAKRQKQSAIIEQLKSEQAKKILKNNEEWRNLIERDRQARMQAEKNAQKRNVINTDIKRMYRLLRDQSATKNMPEYMQALARETIADFVNNDLTGAKILRADPEQLAEATRLLRAWTLQNGEANYGNIMDNLDDAEEAIGQALMLDRDVIYQALNEWNSEIKGKNKLDIIQKRGEILERMQAAVSEIYNAIQAERTVQANKRRITTQDAAYKVMVETKGKKYREWTGKAGGAIRTMHKMIVGGNMTPEYFFRTLNNGGLNDLWANYHDAENRNGLELHKAQERLAEIAKNHGFSNWDMGQKLRVDIGGEQVEMTLGQMMSLWATWKRENTLGPAISEHLTKGGFYAEQDLREGILGRAEVQKKARRVNEQDMQRVEALLSDEQKAFVDDVVGFMSSDMSKLGNEASMAAYGIKLYKEDYYFPFQMWDGIKSRKSNDSGNGANIDQAFHPSFSKTRLHGANNALVIGDFMQTASDHIAGMINYATMGLANDSLQKVLNEKMNDAMMADGNPQEGTVRNIRAILEEAYGRDAVQYLAELQKQLNGGAVRIDKTVYDKAISLFRKNAVAGSLSVAAQQPLSYLRAATMIDAKYLGKALTQEYWKGSYKELLQHSGVAVIKEMGRFDMNAGQSAREYLTPDGMKTKWQAAWDQITDKSTILPEKMDAWTWTRMWVAVKAEQHAEHPEMDMKSDEFLDMCGERFNDIMRRTQVYDSVLVRSENMRSQNQWVKSITSFMAEPTLTLNVLADAVRSWKTGEKGGKALLARAGATFAISAALQAAVKALFSTGRSPDDKKTWLENWEYRFISNLINEADPVQMIPGYSDLISLLKKGKLEDDAMGAVGKMISAGRGMIDVVLGNGEKGLYRDMEDSAGQLVQLFTNLPAKNIMRDLRAAYNWFIDPPYPKRADNANVINYQTKDAILSADNLLGWINKELGEAGYDTSNTGYKKRIYEAMKKGDEKEQENLIDYLLTGKGIKDRKSINSAVKGYIKEDYEDEKIDRKEAVNLMKKTDPGMKEKDITKALDEIEYEKETGEEIDNFSVYMPMYEAIDKDDNKKVTEVKTHLTKNGYTDKDVKDQIKTYILKQYKEGKYTKADTEKKLKSYRPDISSQDIWWEVDRIKFQMETGADKVSGNYYRLKDAIGKNSSKDINSAVKDMKAHGYDDKKIKSWIGNKSTGFKTAYLDAKGNEKVRIKNALIMAYKAVGVSETEANAIINKWK